MMQYDHNCNVKNLKQLRKAQYSELGSSMPRVQAIVGVGW